MAGRPRTREAPEFGTRLAALRLKRGLTQVELAHMLGVSQKTVNHYERRTANPSLELIQRLAAFFDVAASELLGEDDAKPAKKKRREKPGPPSQIERVVERVRGLPRGEQQRILDMIDVAIKSAERRIAE